MSDVVVKRRLLLVDDEPKIVEGLQRLLRPLRAKWDVLTATSPRVALEILEREFCHTVITDMRMPEMDGATFLAVVKQRHPSTVRIVLSGQTDHAAALRVVPVAHQFLNKPCDPATLIEVLTRAAEAQDALGDERVHAAVGGLNALPSAPAIYRELMELLEGDVSLARVATVIERDPAITLKVLQLVNSSFFGLKRRMSNIKEAVAYVGIDLMKSLAMSMSVADTFSVRARRLDSAAFQTHALKVGLMARHIAPRSDLADVCFVAGLLHDVGKLVLATTMPDYYDELDARAAAASRSFEEEELETGHVLHARVGGCLLGLWGLPWPVVETVATQRRPSVVESNEFGAAAALRVAHDLLVAAAADDRSRVDVAYIERFGLGERVDRWFEQAGEILRDR